MKINYDLKMNEQINNFGNTKKTLLLHACCAPCSSAVLEKLSKIFDITILYYNPNIYPINEYKLRLENVKKLLKFNNDEIKLMEIPYNEDDYLDYIKGFEKEIEGGKRCEKCFQLRLEKTAQLAKQNNFDFFTTTLTISPHKNSQIINEIGAEIAEKYKINYLFSDFKKHEGYKRSIELSKQFGLYRQEYCGCRFSIRNGNDE